MDNHKYVELSYILKNFMGVVRQSVVDDMAAESIKRRVDNLQSFIDYLNEEG